MLVTLRSGEDYARRRDEGITRTRKRKTNKSYLLRRRNSTTDREWPEARQGYVRSLSAVHKPRGYRQLFAEQQNDNNNIINHPWRSNLKTPFSVVVYQVRKFSLRKLLLEFSHTALSPGNTKREFISEVSRIIRSCTQVNLLWNALL